MHRTKAAPRWRRAVAIAIPALLSFTLAGCDPSGGRRLTPDSVAKRTELVLASTTSTQDSGLFDALIPAFEAADPRWKVKVVAVGTGEALRLGETGDADVVLVHAKADEERFVSDGFGVERRDVMYNEFIIVGPRDDPAGVEAAPGVSAAMAALAKAGSKGRTVFVSRGDGSGTHRMEHGLWAAAGVETPTPEAGGWYLSTGQGMGETLKVASEKQGYTLSDRATYLASRGALDLRVVRGDGEGLMNQYGVIVVKGARNQQGGQAFFDWVLSPEGQRVIAAFGVEEHGAPLFTPNAD